MGRWFTSKALPGSGVLTEIQDQAHDVPNPDAFEERAAIIEHDAGLPRQEAETLAAQEQGHADADSLHGGIADRWAAEIERLVSLPAVSPEGAEALQWARAFISAGWERRAVRLCWGSSRQFGGWALGRVSGPARWRCPSVGATVPSGT